MTSRGNLYLTPEEQEAVQRYQDSQRTTGEYDGGAAVTTTATAGATGAQTGAGSTGGSQPPSGGAGPPGGGGGTTPPASEPLPPAQLVDIRGGAQWVKVTDPMGTDDDVRWYAIYTVPGTTFEYIFEATTAQVSAIFGEGKEPAAFSTMSGSAMSAHLKGNGNFYGGDISQMEGTESFQSAYERAILDGLGVNTLPPALQNYAEIHALVFLSKQEQWTDSRLYDELAKTEPFQLRFPSIQAFRDENLDTLTAVSAYLEYEQTVIKAARAVLGESGIPTQEEINALIAGKHSAEFVVRGITEYEHMRNNLSALNAFNEVLVHHGNAPMDEEDFYEFVAGKGENEIYDIYEQYSLVEAARVAGLGDGVFDAQDAQSIAAASRHRLGFQGAYPGMQQAAQQLLRYRTEVNLGELSQDDLIDMSLGIAPRSGINQVEILREMGRALSQAQAFTQQKTTPHFGFSPGGTPQASSVSRLGQEAVQ